MTSPLRYVRPTRRFYEDLQRQLGPDRGPGCSSPQVRAYSVYAGLTVDGTVELLSLEIDTTRPDDPDEDEEADGWD